MSCIVFIISHSVSWSLKILSRNDLLDLDNLLWDYTVLSWLNGDLQYMGRLC